MDGPDGSFNNIYNYSSSQENFLKNAAWGDDFLDSHSAPESFDPLPTPDVPGIVFCSIPSTQNANPDGNSLAEMFSTPPEEFRASSSGEQLPQRPDIDTANRLNAYDLESGETVADDADSWDLDGKRSNCSIGIKGNSKLDFLMEKGSKMVELGSGRKVLVGNVSGVKRVASGNTREEKSCSEPPETVSNQGKRVLPLSFTQSMQEDESRYGGGQVSDDPAQVKKSVMEVLAILARKSRKDMSIDEDIDIIETAKKRGMEFPRPSWW